MNASRLIVLPAESEADAGGVAVGHAGDFASIRREILELIHVGCVSHDSSGVSGCESFPFDVRQGCRQSARSSEPVTCVRPEHESSLQEHRVDHHRLPRILTCTRTLKRQSGTVYTAMYFTL